MPHHHSVLVYNITHADLILGAVNPSSGETKSEELLFCKPKFSCFLSASEQVLDRFNNNNNNTSCVSARLVDDEEELRVGFTFYSSPIVLDTDSLHFKYLQESLPSSVQQVQIVAAYLPLAAQLIPFWSASSSTVPSQEQLVLLICGTGRPQDFTAAVQGNSTRLTAELIRQFILQQQQPHATHLSVRIIDSQADMDLYDYHANVTFVREAVVPELERLRRQLAGETDHHWRSHLDLTIALTQGTPARLHALSASLAPFRPQYAHMRQLKTFWNQRALRRADLALVPFEEYKTLPAIEVGSSPLITPEYQLVVDEMKRYRDDFTAAAAADTQPQHELASFWLRKSFRPVLSVLLVRDGQGGEGEERKLRVHRGINLEVSQPTGSLCSERNAIGSALTHNPRLTRRDFVIVAVLALDKLDSTNSTNNNGNKRAKTTATADQLNPLGPCGACTEWLRKITEVNPDFKVMTFASLECDRVFLREVV